MKNEIIDKHTIKYEKEDNLISYVEEIKEYFNNKDELTIEERFLEEKTESLLEKLKSEI